MVIDKKINRYQWNDQIIEQIMHQNEQSGSKIVP